MKKLTLLSALLFNGLASAMMSTPSKIPDSLDRTENFKKLTAIEYAIDHSKNINQELYNKKMKSSKYSKGKKSSPKRKKR